MTDPKQTPTTEVALVTAAIGLLDRWEEMCTKIPYAQAPEFEDYEWAEANDLRAAVARSLDIDTSEVHALVKARREERELVDAK